MGWHNKDCLFPGGGPAGNTRYLYRFGSSGRARGGGGPRRGSGL